METTKKHFVNNFKKEILYLKNWEGKIFYKIFPQSSHQIILEDERLWKIYI